MPSRSTFLNRIPRFWTPLIPIVATFPLTLNTKNLLEKWKSNRSRVHRRDLQAVESSFAFVAATDLFHIVHPALSDLKWWQRRRPGRFRGRRRHGRTTHDSDIQMECRKAERINKSRWRSSLHIRRCSNRPRISRSLPRTLPTPPRRTDAISATCWGSGGLRRLGLEIPVFLHGPSAITACLISCAPRTARCVSDAKDLPAIVPDRRADAKRRCCRSAREATGPAARGWAAGGAQKGERARRERASTVVGRGLLFTPGTRWRRGRRPGRGQQPDGRRRFHRRRRQARGCRPGSGRCGLVPRSRQPALHSVRGTAARGGSFRAPRAAWRW